MEDKPVVLISGFGPFGKHTVNASWVGVKNINVNEFERKNNVRLVQVEIPVVYKTVDDVVPNLWKEHNPKLVVHVGVSSIATEITLECVAHGTNYTRLDCDGVCPTNQCSENNINKIQCKMDIEKLCEKYNKEKPEIKACVSSDAGRFLCEYTYYSSLKIDSSRTLFVHVPEIDGIVTANNIARGLETIVELCLKQLMNRC